MRKKLLLIGVAISLLASVASAQDKSKKVKVFILAGQSNMQGKGSADHLKELVKSEPDKYG